MNEALKKIVAALVLAAAIVYLGNTYLLEPKRVAIKKVKSEREKLEKEIARLRVAQKRVAVIEKEIAQLQSQLDQLKGILPSQKEIPQLLRQVPKLGYYNGIVFSIFRPGKQRVGKIYGTLPVSINFSCSYPQLVS
jgi:type IV pilus assembly protein PilO